jgi:hypothetical protein
MTDGHDFDSLGELDIDIAIGVYALRTFKITKGQLTSVTVSGHHWKDGVCEAECMQAAGQDPTHEAPVEGCSCGIYGTYSLAALRRQFGETGRIVTVIAAEGRTVTGDTGLRTAAARIVAYWIGEPRIGQPPGSGWARLDNICAEQCPGARRYYDVDLMAKIYGLEGDWK